MSAPLNERAWRVHPLWLPGMRGIEPNGRRFRVINSRLAVYDAGGDDGFVRWLSDVAGALPDMADDATVGVLMAQARHMHANAGGSVHIDEEDSPILFGWRVHTTDAFGPADDNYAASYAEAVVVALESTLF